MLGALEDRTTLGVRPSAVPMFGAGPEEPLCPVIVASDGWFVVCMIEAGADGSPPSGTLDSRNFLNESNFF